MKRVNNEIRSKITEHQNNYKLCNLNLISCYSGLYPSSLTKLSMVIFSQLLSNKMYHKQDSKLYDKEEDKRIYTSVKIDPITLLESCHPVKYILEKKDPKNDVGNIVKRINDLHDNNIFYVWKCGFPKNYMFVLERDIGLWKFYNPNGFVTPKTIKKILLSAKGMVANMHRMLSEGSEGDNIEETKRSFCSFIDGLIDKMNPTVSASLERWDDTRGYKEYLTVLYNQILELYLYEGITEDEHFYSRLPPDVKDKMIPKNITRKSHKSLESDLAPKDENLVKVKKTRIRKPKDAPAAEMGTFASIDPFRNSKEFVQYYRSVVKTKNNSAIFYKYETEVIHASRILDKLSEKDRGSKDFLTSWIFYYINKSLNGEYAKKKDKTSLKSFGESLEEYESRYVGCGV